MPIRFLIFEDREILFPADENKVDNMNLHGIHIREEVFQVATVPRSASNLEKTYFMFRYAVDSVKARMIP